MTHTTDANDRMNRPLDDVDLQIADLLREEANRQATGLELIPSENLVSEAVLEAMGSIFTNKYAEGYPGKRYYGGCEYADKVEQLAIDRAKELFGAEHANVQAHSGTSANVAVYMSTLQPGDIVLGMNLSHGGHLTHGHPLNFSGRMYKFIAYGVRKEDERIDYDEIEKLAFEHKPKMIVAGASAYSRIIDFERIAKAAKSVGALFFVDMAHIAGLVAAGMHPSPIRTPTSFPPPPTKRCAGRAADWCCAKPPSPRNWTGSPSPARKAGRWSTPSPPKPFASRNPWNPPSRTTRSRWSPTRKPWRRPSQNAVSASSPAARTIISS